MGFPPLTISAFDKSWTKLSSDKIIQKYERRSLSRLRNISRKISFLTTISLLVVNMVKMWGMFQNIYQREEGGTNDQVGDKMERFLYRH